MKLNFDFFSEEDVDEITEKEKQQIEKYFVNYNEELDEERELPLEDFEILTDTRRNIISWYPFEKEATVLQLNPNFGEITGELCNRCKKVVSISNSKAKAMAIANRYSQVKNLEVIVGTLKKIQLEKEFDYITIIGITGKEEWKEKIIFAKQHLKKNGRILVACNNKWGMMYWSGIQDSKDQEEYASILGKTGNLSLTDIQNLAKEENLFFKTYYPLPDYKLTNVLFSDEYLPDRESMMSRNLCYFGEETDCEFSQREAYIELIKENPEYFKIFANSYFFEIGKEEIQNDIRYVNFETYRKQIYNIKTVMKEKFVYKTANHPAAKEHIENIKRNIILLREKEILTLDDFNDNQIISTYAQNAISLDKYMVQVFKEQGKEATIQVFERFKREILDKFEFSEDTAYTVFQKYKIPLEEEMKEKLHFLKDGLIDLCFPNCFMIENQFYIYDQEWYEENVPIEFILYRIIFYCNDLTKYIQREELYERFEITPYISTFQELDTSIQNDLRNYYMWNLHTTSVARIGRKTRELQETKITLAEWRKKLTEEMNANLDLKQSIHKLKNKLQETNHTVAEIEKAETEKNELAIVNEKQEKQIQKLSQELVISQNRVNDYIQQLRRIENSLSWRLTKPLRYFSWVLNFKNKVKLIDRIMPPGSGMRHKHEEKRHRKILKEIRKSFYPYVDKETAKEWAILVDKVNNEKKYRKFENDYDYWMDSNDLTEEEWKNQREYSFSYTPKISIITPLYNTPVQFFRELLFFLNQQSYTNWELCLADGSPAPLKEIEAMVAKEKRVHYHYIGKNKGISGNTNEALKLATGDYISLLDHDDYLSKDALFEVVKCINENPEVKFIYSDEDKSNGVAERRYDAYFKPDFAPDTLRSQNYICHFSTFKKEVMEELKGFRGEFDGAQDYDIFLRMSEIVKPEEIKHIPKILYHWRVHQQSTAQLNSNAKNYAFINGKKALEAHIVRLGLKGIVTAGDVPGIYRIDYEVEGNPKVSIVIPNKDGIDILKVCIDSILNKTTYQNYEIVIVENNSTLPETFEFYRKIQEIYDNVKVVEYPKKGFNYPGIINYGVKASTGDYIIQLNNDTELMTPNWLELMLGYAQRADVGAVGVKLYYPDDTIQHAGVIVGLGGVAGHRFKNLPREAHAYFAKESMIENLSAVTAACIMTPKRIYEEIDYMDEKLAVAFNDIDFCLKIREKGYLIVYNPYIEFIHYESKSRGLENTPEKVRRFQGEIQTFKRRWKEFLDNGDPYYNKNLEDGSEQYPIKHCKVL